MISTRKRLGDLLVEANLITEEQLQQALKEKEPDQRLGDALLQMGVITEQQLIEVLEFQLGIPHVSLYRYPIDTQILNLIPKEVAKRSMMVPLKKEGNRLFVAMSDPMDYYAIDDLRLSTGFQIEVAIATKDDILRAINRYYELDASMMAIEEEEAAAALAEGSLPSEEADSPIIRLVHQILTLGVQQKASDIHIDPQEREVLIRYRVDGILRTERALPKHMQNNLTARIKIMANMNITEQRIPQDGRIKTVLDFHPVDLRVSTLPSIFGEKIVLRILDLSNSLIDLTQMGFHPTNMERVERMLAQPTGMVLITGPTGSGKSSTLYAFLNRLNTEEVNIITIEDPVEYHLEGINQVQVNPSIGLTFANGLRSILRQDPDIIMVGEIRDSETAEIVVRASLTGHLVLSTIHTNDSISTITRLIDMKVEPFLVAASLSGIISQRLIRKVCRDCAEVQPATEREKELFAERGIEIETITRGRGCGVCGQTGYRGRLAIHEILEIDRELRNLIMNNKSINQLHDYAIKQNTIFLLDDGLLKVKQGLTTTEEVLRVALNH